MQARIGNTALENLMNRIDHDKVSWLEFLKSIKFAQHNTVQSRVECASSFANFNPQARKQTSAEESQLIRSAN
jgi:hypothetical protein